jgi:hypothetical protein
MLYTANRSGKSRGIVGIIGKAPTIHETQNNIGSCRRLRRHAFAPSSPTWNQSASTFVPLANPELPQISPSGSPIPVCPEKQLLAWGAAATRFRVRDATVPTSTPAAETVKDAALGRVDAEPDALADRIADRILLRLKAGAMRTA